MLQNGLNRGDQLIRIAQVSSEEEMHMGSYINTCQSGTDGPGASRWHTDSG